MAASLKGSKPLPNPITIAATNKEQAKAVSAIYKVQLQENATKAAFERYITATWNNLPNLDEKTVAAWAEKTSNYARGIASRQVATTDAYLAQIESLTRGVTVQPLGLNPAEFTPTVLRGVPSEEVYMRPRVSALRAWKEAGAEREAMRAGLNRALSIANTDMQLAKTHASSRILLAKKSVVGYRRVLTGSKACGLCAVASSQRYHKQELMPIHPGCHCTVAPIYGTSDPGQVIDREILKAVAETDEISERFDLSDFNGGLARTADLRTKVVVHQHGEIGPVLGVQGQHFTGPADLVRSA